MSNTRMYIKTALKIVVFCLITFFIMMLAAAAVMTVIPSAGLGVVTMMGMFLLCFFVFAELYPRIFKEFKIYWDDREAKRLEELKLENEECHEKEHEGQAPLM